MPLESEVKRDILKKLKKNYPDAVWYKIHGGPYQERGIPDIIGCLKGRFVAFEIKRPDKYRNPTLYQKFQIQSILHSGGIAKVITDYEGAEKILKFFFKKT